VEIEEAGNRSRLDNLLAVCTTKQSFFVSLFLIACGITIAHRPDSVTNPQFWAEDGVLWYPCAYTEGLRCLAQPVVGYLQTLPRLVAFMAQFLPIVDAPALFNMVAIVIEVLPAVFLMGRRFSRISPTARLLLVILYLLLPNSGEVHANLTSAQWHAALLAFMVVIAQPAADLASRNFDVVVLVLSGLTGPFCILLFPIAVAVWWIHRSSRGRFVNMAVVAGCAVAQLSSLALTMGRQRSTAPLGATAILLMKIVGGQVVLGFLALRNNNLAILTIATALAIAGIAYAVVRGTMEVRAFAIFSWALLAAALVRPQGSLSEPQWPILATAHGIRYWMFPMLGLAVTLVWLAGTRVRLFHYVAVAILLMNGRAMVRDFRCHPYANLNFGAYTREFSQAKYGTTVEIPINPPGWKMQLTKH
jgi:hypothetical protein